MGKPKYMNDTGTIADLLLKQWSDSYPPEKRAEIKSKAAAIDTSCAKTRERIDTLKRAQIAIDDLSVPLLSVLRNMEDAVSKHRNFLNAFGDGGVKIDHTPEQMDDTITSYCNELTSFSDRIKEAYLQDCKLKDSLLTCILYLRDIYISIADIADIIDNQYFKTPSDRRKPILRDLIRRFQELGSRNENKLTYLLPSKMAEAAMENYKSDKTAEKVIDAMKKCVSECLDIELDYNEFKSLVAIFIEASNTAKLLKHSR